MLIRVTEEGQPASQLRKGEPALSVFDEEAVEPPLAENEVLGTFRAGSSIVRIDRSVVEGKGLLVVMVRGAENLPVRLQEAHAEIQPNPTMSRKDFKRKLKDLEP
jgi:hypothetical protein